MYAFVYDSLIDFPTSSDNTFDTITTKNVFKNVHKMTKVKVHLYHSHVTEKILGYVINFHNLRIRENKSEIRIIAHNLFGFDMFFFFFEGLSSHCLVYKRHKVWRFQLDTYKFC